MKNSKKKIVGFIMVTMMIMIGLIGCGSDSNGDQLKDTYTVVGDTSFVPFEFKEDGEYVGFEIDLIHALADEVGFEVDYKTTNFDGIIPGLQTGTFDIALAGIGITEKRAKKIDYSDSYYESGLRIGVPSDNEDINGIEDLEGKVVATRLGSTSAKYIEENIEGATANQYEQLDQAYLAVENGSADAIFYDAPNVAYYIQTKGEDSLKIVGDLYAAESYGIAFSKGNDTLVEEVNKALETIKENGKYDEIYKKWFGEEPA